MLVVFSPAGREIQKSAETETRNRFAPLNKDRSNNFQSSSQKVFHKGDPELSKTLQDINPIITHVQPIMVMQSMSPVSLVLCIIVTWVDVKDRIGIRPPVF